MIPSSADQRLYLNSTNLRLMLAPQIIDIKDSSPDVDLLACTDLEFSTSVSNENFSEGELNP